ncbi:MAG: acetylhydrolase [Armatimonadaceae bacterium]
MVRRFLTGVMLALMLSSGVGADKHAEYDPLRVEVGTPEQKELVVKDDKRKREIPVRVYLPKVKKAAPVVLFSHGLGGSRDGNRYLGNHWAARGYVAVFLQHPGSDDSVWKDISPAQRMAAMQKAASAENFQRRIQDVPAVLDQLEVWNKNTDHPLAGRLDMKRIGMSGHSFGAMTTQAMSGQRFPVGRGFTDERIQAAVIMSPSSPRRGGSAKQAFGSVKLPWMLLTGTNDTAPIGDADMKSRLAVFPALPPGDKYELVLHQAEHSAFTDRALPGDSEKRNPNHHKAILAVTTAFWDAYLRNDAGAKNWLNSESVREVLEKEDRWQKK